MDSLYGYPTGWMVERMKNQEAKCTNCGAGLEVVQDTKIVVCGYCASTIILENAIDFAKNDPSNNVEIQLLRENLAEYLKRDSILEIKRISSLLKDLVPQDFRANYYLSYALYHEDNEVYYYSFLKNPPAYTELEMNEIANHIIRFSPIEEKPQLTKFLEVYLPSRVKDYHSAHRLRVNREEHYHNVPRDFFISFSKYDYNTAKDVVEKLEGLGFTCWISRRNLRPNSEDKRQAIVDAIENTKCVIIITSEQALLSRDVQLDIEIAIEYNKSFLELAMPGFSANDHSLLFQIALKSGRSIQLSRKNTIPSSEIIEYYESLKQSPQGEDVLVINETPTSPLSLKDMTQELLSLIQYVLINNRTNNDVLEFMYYMTGVRPLGDLTKRQKKLFATMFESLSEIYRSNLDYDSKSFSKFQRYVNKRSSQPNLLSRDSLIQLLKELDRQVRKD